MNQNLLASSINSSKCKGQGEHCFIVSEFFIVQICTTMQKHELLLRVIVRQINEIPLLFIIELFVCRSRWKTQCCGAYGPSDFESLNQWNRSYTIYDVSYNTTVPPSCCTWNTFTGETPSNISAIPNYENCLEATQLTDSSIIQYVSKPIAVEVTHRKLHRVRAIGRFLFTVLVDA